MDEDLEKYPARYALLFQIQAADPTALLRPQRPMSARNNPHP